MPNVAPCSVCRAKAATGAVAKGKSDQRTSAANAPARMKRRAPQPRQQLLHHAEEGDLDRDAVGPERADQPAAEAVRLPVERAEGVEDAVRAERQRAGDQRAPQRRVGERLPQAELFRRGGGAGTRGDRSATSPAMK